MNKKFLGISALLALILSSCGGTPSVDPSGSSVEPTTSETSSEGGSDSGTSTTSEDTPVALNDVLDKLESLGHVYEGRITIGNEVLQLKQNADYTYLQGVGGIAKIVPVTPEPEPEEGGEGQPEEGGEQGGEQGGEAQGLVHNYDENEPTRLLKRALNDPEEGEGEEEAEAKYFMFLEGKGENDQKAFQARWGALYDYQSEFLANNTAGGLGAIIKSVVAQMSAEDLASLIAYNKAGKFYQIRNASYISAFASLTGLALTGLNLSKMNLSFEGDQFKIGFYQTATESAPSINVTLEAKAEVADADLEAWLGAFADYPHSPVALEDVLDMFNTVNYNSATNLDDLDPQYDLTLGFSATENGYGIMSLGQSWQDSGTVGGVLEVSETGYEISQGYYGYDTTIGGKIATEDLDSLYELYGYEYEGKWYDMWTNPSFVGYNKDIFGANPVETFNGFFFDTPTYVNYMARNFRGISAASTVFTFTIEDNPRNVPEGYALETITKAKEMYINYTLDLEGKVNTITVTAELALYDKVFLENDPNETEVAALSGWNEVYPDDRFEIYETYQDFGTTVTEADKFVGETLRKVVFDEEKIAPQFTLDVNEKVNWSLEGKYTPADLEPYYVAYFDDGTIDVNEETGEVTGLSAGYDYVFGVVGGAEIYAKATVRGMLAWDNDAYEYVDEINAFPGEEKSYELDLFGLENAPVASVVDDTVALASVVALHDNEDDPEEVTGYELQVSALKNGKTTVQIIVSENDKTYDLFLPITVSPDIKFNQDDAFVYVGEDAAVEVTVFASEAEVSVKSSNEEVVTATFDAEESEVVLHGVAAGVAEVEVSMVIDEVTYKDTIKVSATNNDFVGAWVITSLMDEEYNYAYITLHEDGSVLFEMGEQQLTATWANVVQDEQALAYACDITGLDLTSLGLSLTVSGSAYDVMDIGRITVLYPDTNATAKVYIGVGSQGTKLGNVTTILQNLYVEEFLFRGTYSTFYAVPGYASVEGLAITIYNNGYFTFSWTVGETKITAKGYLRYAGDDDWGDPLYSAFVATDSEELPYLSITVGYWNASYREFMISFYNVVEEEPVVITEGLPEGAAQLADMLGGRSRLF